MENQEVEFLVPFKKAPDTDKIALIDADYLKYLVVYDMLKDIQSKNVIVYKNPVHHYAQKRIDNVLNSFNAKGYLFCFSGPSDNTFRCSVSFDKKYKGNRTYVENYENELQDKVEVVDYIRDRYPSVKYNDLEADDLLCMLQDEDTFIYSNDKDLLQIPGMHWDINKGVFLEVSNEDAMLFLMKQMLTGDSVDNISGLKSCGPVGADKILTNIPVMRQPLKILMEYMKKHGAINGMDCFVEAWNLLKLRGNRGDFFLSKYKSAFDTLRLIKNS